MNLSGDDRFSLHPTSSMIDDVLIRMLLLEHDPDGRHLDSELLLCAMENIMCYATTSEVCNFQIDPITKNDICNIEVVGSSEPLGQIICRVSSMLCRFSNNRDLHARTMSLFDLLKNYRWDAKAVLILAAFATTYGEFWLLTQLYPSNPLAVSVAMLKQLPSNMSALKPQFKALKLLVMTMVQLTKSIIRFEGLPFTHVKLDDEAMSITKSWIYTAVYWLARSTLACTSQIIDMRAMKPVQVYSNSTVIAVWELSSLVYKLNAICSHLSQQVEICHQQTEKKMQQKISSLFQGVHTDNQEVLGTFLALKDDLPLKHSSTQEKIGVSELKDKVVVFLISKPELLPLDGLLLLVHQTFDHPNHEMVEGSYEMVWMPVAFSDTWTDEEAQKFIYLSNSLPWYSVRKPWALNSAVVNYVKQEWSYKDDPLMVALDSQGKVTNSNAIDMVLIWGTRAYPFSSSREKELWGEQKWTIQLLVDQIDPLLTSWVDEGRNICIYVSDNLDWIREFTTQLKGIRSEGVQLEMVYVGNKNLNEHVRHILATINEEMHSSLLSVTKLHFFWLRIESMRRSKLRLGQGISSDHVLEQVLALLDTNTEGWVVIGGGNTADTVQLQGRKALECLTRFPEWRKRSFQLGFLSALRTELEPPSVAGPCNHSIKMPYTEGQIEETQVCDICKHQMKKYVVYE